jgi:hypothetical protein
MKAGGYASGTPRMQGQNRAADCGATFEDGRLTITDRRLPIADCRFKSKIFNLKSVN